MQRAKGIMRLLSASMYVCIYVCMGLGQLNARNLPSNIPTKIGLVSGIYQCQSSTSPLLSAYVAQKSKLPTSVKPTAQLLLNSCEQNVPLICPSTLSINGSISITNSKDVAITVNSLSDITVEEGALQIAIPAGGSFKINGTAYTSSPINGLTITQNSTSGIRIDCNNSALSFISYGVYIGSGITLDVQGDVTMSGNSATSDSGSAYGAYGAVLGGNIIAGGAITINNNQATGKGANNAYGISFRVIGGGFSLGGSITGSGTITISSNSATSDSGSAYGVYNDGTITSSGSITISDNSGTSDSGIPLGVYNGGTITSSGAITMSNNSGTSSGSGNAYGVYNNGTITSSGDITMSDNSGTNNGSATALGVYNGDSGTITSSGDITMSNNQATSSGNGEAIAVNNNSGTIKTTGSGAITMSNNSGTNNGSGTAYGVYNFDTITSSGAITMSNNQATSSAIAYGVFNYSGSVMKTDANFIITVAATNLPANTTQNFNSSDVAITNVAGTALPFASFTVTVDGTPYTTYGSIPGGAVVLNAANQN